MTDKEPIDWDALDADTQHELVSLAEKLGENEPEQEAKRTASRREFLGAVTAAGLGGSLLSQGADKAVEDFISPASAGTQSVAQFGEAGEPFDFVAEDIYGPGGQGSGDPVSIEAVSRKASKREAVANWLVDEGTATDIGDAVNQLWSDGYGRVIVKREGEFGVFENITPIDLDNANNRYSLIGHGRPNLRDAGGSPLLINSGTDVKSYFTFKDLRFDVQNTDPSHIVQFDGVDKSLLQNVSVDGLGNSTNTAVRHQRNGAAGNKNLWIECKFEDAPTVFEAASGPGQIFIGGYIRGSGSGNIGIDYQESGDWHFYGTGFAGFNNGLADNVAQDFNADAAVDMTGVRYEQNTNRARFPVSNTGELYEIRVFFSSGGGIINPSNADALIENGISREGYRAPAADSGSGTSGGGLRLQDLSGTDGFIYNNGYGEAVVGDSDKNQALLVNYQDITARVERQDLTASGAPEPGIGGVIATHDGSGSQAAGAYESDPATNQWVGIGTASGNTIPY